jgi:hypothetical protein
MGWTKRPWIGCPTFLILISRSRAICRGVFLATFNAIFWVGIWRVDGFSGKAESCAAMAVHIAKNRKMKRCDFIADLGRWATVRFGVGKFIGKWGPRKGGSEYLPILRTDHLAIPLEM